MAVAEDRVQAYRRQAQQLLPLGRAWQAGDDSTLARVLEGLVHSMAELEDRGAAALAEAFPALTSELLGDWERNHGLPGPCDELAQTIGGRRAALLAKLSGVGGLSIEAYQQLAAALGYGIEVEEHHAFRVGSSAVGEPLAGEEWGLAWTVHAAVATGTWLTCEGDSDAFLVETGNDTLECFLEALKPAHTAVHFAYDLPWQGWAPWEVLYPEPAVAHAVVPAATLIQG